MDVKASEDGGVIDALLWDALDIRLDVRAAARAARTGPQLREPTASRWREKREPTAADTESPAAAAARLVHQWQWRGARRAARLGPSHPPPMPAAALEPVRERCLTHRQLAHRRTLPVRAENC